MKSRAEATWESLGLPQDVWVGMADHWKGPRAFQIEVARAWQAGGDLIIQAPTGSGKTLAYGWPLLSRCLSDAPKLRGLVVVPTRELAVQVTRALRDTVAAPSPVVSAVYGGVDPRNQSRAIARGVDLLVATPGRLLDLMARGQVDLSAIEAWVIDEADEIWKGGFRAELLAIRKALPERIRTVWVSATADPHQAGNLPPWWPELPRVLTPDPSSDGNSQAPIPAQIRHGWVQVQEAVRRRILLAILQRDPGQAFVFVNQRDAARPLTQWLRKQGIPTAYLTARSTQSERQMALDRFRQGEDRVLVATDLASRGLDVLAARTVINYEVPTDRTHYWHRAGRTGRAGMDGTVYTLSAPSEAEAMKRLRAEVAFEIVRVRPADERTRGAWAPELDAPGFNKRSARGPRPPHPHRSRG